MNIHVVSSVNEIISDQLAGKTVIVIDVLRATSTIITAIANGCSGVIPVETVQQAKNSQIQGDLLGGERFCQKIHGFDLGNSPFEYGPEIVAGKTIVMTTTNGTRAIQKSQKAAHILAGSMLNATACAVKALEFGKDIVVLCSGTNDAFSLEDGLCAGLLEEMVRLSEKTVATNDFGTAMMHAYDRVRSGLTEAILSCSNGTRLAKLGLTEDIVYCTQINKLKVVPLFQDGMMKQIKQIAAF